MYSCKILVVALSALLGVSHNAAAEQSDDSALIQLRSQNAYNSVFGLPAVASRPVQTREWQVALEHANQFAGGTEGEEVLILDGESTELVIRHRQRFGACVQLEAVLPFVQHSGGVLDEAIDRWHNIFGLPDAGRDETPSDELNFAYENGDGAFPGVDSAESGLGDIQLSIQRSIGCQATSDATASEPIVRAGLKLPTGSVSGLRGSGELDLFVDLQSPVFSHGRRWRTGAAVGALYLGSSSDFSSQKNLAAYGTFGTQYILSNRWRLLAQLDWHTPFFNSRLTELGDPAVNLSGAVRFLGPADQTIEFSISEDIAIDTTPDVVFRLAWTYRPAGGL